MPSPDPGKDGNRRQSAIEGERMREKGDSRGLEMPRTLVGGKPTWVNASHEPSIEPCCASGNRRVDA